MLKKRDSHDPFAMLRQMTGELDRMFDEPFPSFRWPFGRRNGEEGALWAPKIEVFERKGQLITRVELPGLTRDDVKVEATDGQLTISGERRQESESTRDNVYRSEREYGSFYRAVPLPEGTDLDKVKAQFTDGVLEVAVPLPAAPAAKARTVQIEGGGTAKQPAA